jgi:hypothetical protein
VLNDYAFLRLYLDQKLLLFLMLQVADQLAGLQQELSGLSAKASVRCASNRVESLALMV